jgi:predicted transcriptional regulator
MAMAVLANPEYDVLNVVALKKMSTTQALAEATGLPPDRVSETLTALSQKHLVVIAAGQVFPADDADGVLRASAAERYATVREDGGILALVDRFEEINAQLLATMSAWQQVDVGGQKVTNDHTDASYDDRVIARISRLVQRLDPLLAALHQADPRFASYRERFTAALAGIDDGRAELVSSPTLDSVHTIWFEFHEDLLRTLGRARKE